MKTPPLTHFLRLAIGAFLSASLSTATVVNADFSRDTAAQNPGSNPAPILYSGTGPLSDTGTVWNDLRVPLTAAGDDGADSVLHPVQFDNLSDSAGNPTTIDIQLTSGFFRSFNSTQTSPTAPTSLQNERVFSRNGTAATLTIRGLDPAKRYTLAFIDSSNFLTAYTVAGFTKTATGTAYGSAWVEGATHVQFGGISPTPTGEIVVGIQDGAATPTGFGVICGLQITESAPIRFFYPDAAASSGGQFSASYPPSNLQNNGFTSPSDTIDTTGDYLAANNNYASASATTANFDLTFDFSTPAEIDGMHIWNYVYRSSGAGGTSPNSGVNSYTLTFFDGSGGSGSTIGTIFSGTLAKAAYNALNTAQTIDFGNTYPNVRSVVMHVVSNHTATGFTGMNELAFNGVSGTPPPASITSFTTSAPFVQRPATPTLSWTVSGTVTSLEISPGIGDVLPLTAGGSGSVPVSPIGEQTYTLTLNGTITQQVSVIGLPVKEKLHLYLLIGQSNMQGNGQSYNAGLDSPAPRVIKFGSRDGMEQSFVTGGHPLTSLSTTPGSKTGMGVEFGKTLLAAESDPEVVICLINHALGSTAIEWWEPGATNGVNGTKLYDNAITRINNASSFGVLKGVLWHQGEYNSNNNTNPSSDPNGYAARLSALVDNLRTDFNNPSLPFVCGKFVPRDWGDGGSVDDFTGLPSRAIVEAALDDLPNQRTNTFSVNNNGLRGNSSDRIHFDAASQRLLGQRYAAAMIGFYSDPFLLYLGGFHTPAEMMNPQLINPGGDNDDDGYSNFLEFAFLTDPSTPETEAPFTYTTVNIPGQGNFPAITFRQRFDSEAPDYLVQVSPDLSTWLSNLDGPVTETAGPPVDNNDGTSSVTVRLLTPIAPADPRRFLRLRVSQP